MILGGNLLLTMQLSGAICKFKGLMIVMNVELFQGIMKMSWNVPTFKITSTALSGIQEILRTVHTPANLSKNVRRFDFRTTFFLIPCTPKVLKISKNGKKFFGQKKVYK